jgi:hypothetical protein
LGGTFALSAFRDPIPNTVEGIRLRPTPDQSAHWKIRRRRLRIPAIPAKLLLRAYKPEADYRSRPAYQDSFGVGHRRGIFSAPGGLGVKVCFMKKECCDQTVGDASKRADEARTQSAVGRCLRCNFGDERAGVPSLDVSDEPGRNALFGPKQPIRSVPANRVPGQFAILGVACQPRADPTGPSFRSCRHDNPLHRMQQRRTDSAIPK